MWLNRLNGGKVRVSALPTPSLLASLRAALNTRFANYTNTACDPSGAAPDINVKSYAFDQNNVVRWMNPQRGNAVALEMTERGKLETG